MGNLLGGLYIAMSIWWCCCSATTSFSTASATDGNWGVGTSFFNNIHPVGGVVVFGKHYVSAMEQVSGYVNYDNVTIPNAATITSAKIAVSFSDYTTALWQSSPPYSAPPSGTASCDIYGEDADTATTLTSASQADGLTRTTASVAYSHDKSEYAYTDSFETPDLTSIVQEIVNRAGWTSGNRMQFLFDEDGTSSSYTSDPTYGTRGIAALVSDAFFAGVPTLSVTYT